MTQIFGVTLVKNEDIFIERVLKNISDFCDEILVLEIVEGMTSTYDNIHLMRWDNPANSGQALEHLIGEDCWVFGVDGDEIYDPVGLSKMSEDILAGIYSDTFHLCGSSLHCNKITNDTMCRGWLDARPIGKLYNFSILDYWNQTERLHGQHGMKSGYEDKKIQFAEEKGGEYSWEESPLRCVHTCFLRRSSNDPEEVAPRKHPLGEVQWKERKYFGKNLIKKQVNFI